MANEMVVEVNETNIALYELVQLTGNSREDLLKAAAEAEENGYILTCKIPNPDGPLEVNAFEHFDSTPAPKVERHIEESHVVDHEGRHLRTDFNIVDVVRGEVVEDEN